MIRYELKDKSWQEALEKALPGFKEELQARCAWAFEDEENYVGVSHGDDTQHPGFYWEVDIPKEQIEVIGKYDPKKWNKFPEVTPPTGVLMRCEGRYRYGGMFVGAAAWDKGMWCPLDPMTGPADIVVDAFRPWDEEKES